MYFRLILLVVFVMFTSLCFALDDDELPFGYFSLINESDSASLDSIAGMLGANIVFAGINADNVRAIKRAGMWPIANTFRPWQTYVIHKAHYAQWEAEEQDLEIKFDQLIGGAGSGADSIYWVVDPDTANPGSIDIVLDDLKYKQPQRNTSDVVVNYYIKLKLWVDTADINSGDTLGFLNVFVGWGESPQDSFPIIADTFFIENPCEYMLTDSLVMPNDVVKYQVTTTNLCTLKIDYLKVYNETGRLLVEEHWYDNQIAGYVCQSWGHPDTVYAWELRDEPPPALFLSYRYADSLIRAVTDTAFGQSIFGTSCFAWGVCQSAQTYLEIIDPEQLNVIMYPFYGSQTDIETRYTGDVQGGNYQGLQLALQKIEVFADSTRELANEYNKDWFYVAQSMAGRSNISEGFFFRWPTASELSCETFMGLCYDPGWNVLLETWQFLEICGG
ncbi:MAG: hypothetical protein J7K40_15460 [candidate division Zixibacteria bacterium]|nr:hypothetical protein [candidate division Zixibacteria bacterium]